MSRPAPRIQAPKPLPANAEAPAFRGSAIEDARTQNTLDSIRSFVRAAQGNWNMVPIRNGTVALTTAEAEAFRADTHGEKSFRGDYAAHMMQSVALLIRMTMELEDYNSKRDSAYLWKPHADALTYLIASAARLFESATNILAVAEQRGLLEKVKSLNASLDRLKTQTAAVAKALQS